MEGQQWWNMGCTKCNKSVKKTRCPAVEYQVVRFQCNDPRCDSCPAVPRYGCLNGTYNISLCQLGKTDCWIFHVPQVLSNGDGDWTLRECRRWHHSMHSIGFVRYRCRTSCRFYDRFTSSQSWVRLANSPQKDWGRHTKDDRGLRQCSLQEFRWWNHPFSGEPPACHCGGRQWYPEAGQEPGTNMTKKKLPTYYLPFFTCQRLIHFWIS
jgi:hypothetical protein